jgi:5'-deoxynucleotidase YfbR-like HD superfamily hydrolase
LRPVDRVTYLREASNVERAHTLPHHGSYTVGKHSYDAVMLLLALNPSASPELIKAVLYHDLGERFTGDVPTPAKHADGEMARRLDQAEAKARDFLALGVTLTADERVWLHAVDKVELLLWCKDQLALGNMNAAAIIGTLVSQLNHMELPQIVVEFIQSHEWTRHPDTLPS